MLLTGSTERGDDPSDTPLEDAMHVRGGTHIVAYAKALEALSGVDIGKLLPIPDISNKRFPEALKHEAKGLHQVMYRMSPDDYRDMAAIWQGPILKTDRSFALLMGHPRAFGAAARCGAAADVAGWS